MYKITLKQKQPIHLGVGNFGVVAETREYALPHQFVAAMCNKLGISHSVYPIEDKNNFDNIIKNVSIFKPKNFSFEDKNDFSLNYKKSMVSSAVKPNTHTAKDESLHEIEFIVPSNDQGDKNLEWEGYIKEGFEIDGKDMDYFKKELNWEEIYLGGERKYWYGLCEIEIKKVNDKKDLCFIKNISNEETVNKEVLPITMRITKKTDKVGKKFDYKWFYKIK